MSMPLQERAGRHGLAMRAASFVAAAILLMCSPAHAAPVNARPYMGWSSWSLECLRAPGYGTMDWLTAEHVKQQSDLLHAKLQKFGYRYINLDSGWQRGYDAYGRPQPDARKFPEGIAGMARYVHTRGQKLGIYFGPGVSPDLVRDNPPILGTDRRIRDILAEPLRKTNGWRGAYKIDFSRPGAQEYVQSMADLFASWGIDFLKFDGVTPGSSHKGEVDTLDDRPDVAAWWQALKKTRRPIWLELSWNLDMDYADFWKAHSHGRRITDDVEKYGAVQTGWDQLSWRFAAAAAWAPHAGSGQGWNDLDSLLVACGEMDGITSDERRTAVTLWAVACSPLYTGDDLTRMDALGIELLTNREVIAVDQAGRPARPLAPGQQQVWAISNPDGSRVVALFNLAGASDAAVTANWTDLGLVGAVRVRDLWARRDLGLFRDHFTAVIPPHGCRLLRLRPNAR